MDVGPDWGDSENEASSAPERTILTCCALLTGVGHIRARVSKRGKNWSKENHPDPFFRVRMVAKVEKRGSWNVEDAQRPNIWGASHTLESVIVCLNVIPSVLLPSVSQFSRSVTSDSLRPHEPQHARPPCPSPTPRVHPNSCPLSQ